MIKNTLVLAFMAMFTFHACDSTPHKPEPLPKPIHCPKIKPLPPRPIARQVKLWATYYSVPILVEDSMGYEVRDMSGKPLGIKLTLKSWCNLAMEGSGRIGNRVVNYYGTTRNSYGIDCKRYYKNHPAISRSKFYITKGNQGVGNRDNPLTPFKSIACDQKRFKFGQKFLIPDAVGTKLPDGSLHDGEFICEDVGGAIKDNHIDIFLGSSQDNPFKWVKSNLGGTFFAYTVEI